MTFRAEAILFDLDGTLVHSIVAVDRAWTRFAIRHNLDPASVLPQIHGRRALDSIQLLLPHVDAEAESAVLRAWESEDTEGISLVPGALEFLRSLPSDRWGIVTSGTQDVASARLQAVGIPQPKVFVTGEQVINGKPSPDAYLLGAERLMIPPDCCLVFEDVLAGYLAGKAAGMQVVAITSSPTLPKPADAKISDYRGCVVQLKNGVLTVVLS